MPFGPELFSALAVLKGQKGAIVRPGRRRPQPKRVELFDAVLPLRRSQVAGIVDHMVEELSHSSVHHQKAPEVIRQKASGQMDATLPKGVDHASPSTCRTLVTAAGAAGKDVPKRQTRMAAPVGFSR